jgi:hypothetical protein
MERKSNPMTEEPYGRTKLRKGEGPRPRVIRKNPEGEGRPREVPSSISGETELEKKRVATGEKLQG